MINDPALEMFIVLSSLRVEQMAALTSSSCYENALTGCGEQCQEVICANQFFLGWRWILMNFGSQVPSSSPLLFSCVFLIFFSNVLKE